MKSKPQVLHFDLYGKREAKYDFLNENSLSSIAWNELEPKEPNFFFVKKDDTGVEEYEKGFKLDVLFPLNASGIKTQRDDASIKFNQKECDDIKHDFLTLENDQLVIKYGFKDVRDWTIDFAKNDLKKNPVIATQLSYRPFDIRAMNYTGKTKGVMGYPRFDVMKHFLPHCFNLGLILVSQPQAANLNYFDCLFITKQISDTNYYRRGGPSCFPLYLYPDQKSQLNFDQETGRVPNLNMEIVQKIADGLGLKFVPEKNSPLLEGCPSGGVVFSINTTNSSPREILTTINNIPIYRNFVKNLPHNPALNQLAKDKRKEGILSEVLFWQQVHKGVFYKIDFDRQRIIGNYIVDFYVKALGLVIEIDGNSHDEKQEYDAKRQAYLESLGLKVFRCRDIDVKKNINAVFTSLENFIVNEYGEKTTPAFSHPSTGGEFSPIDILDYIYAVLHSPSYREKYKEFLKIDFPRVPYPTDTDKFWNLVELGGQLRELHLLESPTVNEFITEYQGEGDNVVGKIKFEQRTYVIEKVEGTDSYLVSNNDAPEPLGRVHINENQYFDNVPESAWNFYIGGYQPAQKWLKDRKDRELNFEDILHYQKIIVALTETSRIMGEIDDIEL